MKSFLITLELLSGISLVIAILLHSPKGEGLGSIGGQSRMFNPAPKGMEAGLNKVTYGLAVVFFVVAAILGLFF